MSRKTVGWILKNHGILSSCQTSETLAFHKDCLLGQSAPQDSLGKLDEKESMGLSPWEVDGGSSKLKMGHFPPALQEKELEVECWVWGASMSPHPN